MYTKKYAEEIQLPQELNSRFHDTGKYETTISLSSMPCDINVETVPAEFQMEMLNMQCDMDLRNTFRHVQLLVFYK
jgi:hypothetical protein